MSRVHIRVLTLGPLRSSGGRESVTPTMLRCDTRSLIMSGCFLLRSRGSGRSYVGVFRVVMVVTALPVVRLYIVTPDECACQAARPYKAMVGSSAGTVGRTWAALLSNTKGAAAVSADSTTGGTGRVPSSESGRRRE